MKSLLEVNSGIRLRVGLILFVLSLLGIYLLRIGDYGFWGGLITGMLFGIGLGLVLTYKKTK